MEAANLGTETHAYAFERQIDELADGRDAQLQERVARCGLKRQPVELDLARRGALVRGIVKDDRREQRRGDTPLFSDKLPGYRLSEK